MKRVVFLFLLSVIALNMSAQSKDAYKQLWLKVEQWEQKSLPQSAAAEVNKILKKAVAEKNSPQVIKALIHQGKYDLALDAEKDTMLFVHLNEMLAKSKDAVEKSVLHSMLGELYLQYYEKDSWTIDQRTALAGLVPEDMKEWTRNIFYEKAVEHLTASLRAQSELEKIPVEKYTAIVELGKDARQLYPSMYDFLALRAIRFFQNIRSDKGLKTVLAQKQIASKSLFAPTGEFIKLNFNPQPKEYDLWTLETYRALLASLQRRGLDKSVVLTELDKLDYLEALSDAYKQYAHSFLQQMLEQWKNKDFSVEVIDKLAESYANNVDDDAQAYDLLTKGIEAFPKYERIGLLHNFRNELTSPFVHLSGNGTYAPNTRKEIKVKYRNVNQVVAKLYRLETPLWGLYGGANPLEKKKFVKQIIFKIPEQKPFVEKDTTFVLDVNELGAYKLELENGSKNKDADNYYYFSISELATFARQRADSMYEVFVVNRVTGVPIPNASIEIYKEQGNWNNRSLQLQKTVKTNESGLAVLERSNREDRLFYHIVFKEDKGLSLSSFPHAYYPNNSYTSDEDTQNKIAIFTDRDLYRPGQTVYFKAVVSATSVSKGVQLVAKKWVDVILRDGNSQEISRKKLLTNEFGSVSGEFVLPQKTMSGAYQIEIEETSYYLSVEEYKRPTFEVTFDKIDQTYQFEQPITVKGTAQNFSGIKLQNAQVNYRITRSRNWFWRGGAPQQFDQGTAITDANGNFEIRFIPKKEDRDGGSHRNRWDVYRFAIEATVTDVNGESQTGNYSVNVSDVSMTLSIEIPEQVEKSQNSTLSIVAKNLDGKDINAKGTYRLYSLLENDVTGEEVLSGDFTAGEQKELMTKIQNQPSGKYKLEVKAKDDQGNEVQAEKTFVLFSYADKRPPIKTNEWLVKKSTTMSKNRNAEIILGVSDKNVKVLYELWNEYKMLERKWLTLSEENRTFTVPYKPEYEEGLRMMFTYVKDQTFYAHSIDLSLEKEEKGLDVKLDVFRDKLRPGAREEWRISVKDKKGNAAVAEILASMYDFSLDKIKQTSAWSLVLDNPRMLRNIYPLGRDESFENIYRLIYYPSGSDRAIPNFVLDQFNWFDFSFYSYGRNMMLRSMISPPPSPMMEEVAVAEEKGTLDDVVVTSYGEKVRKTYTGSAGEAKKLSSDDNSSDTNASHSAIRRNFNETAFFFPQLRTNEKGETQIAFTVPESNTRWRFRVLAHDKNRNVGQAEAFAVSQKELMVTPNMPRFLRQGDRASISTKISNLSDKTVSGNVKMEFFNPVTDEIINTISLENQLQPFSLKKDESSDAKWVFDVPVNIDIIGVRIVAQSESFSDGEQHALAVLPNRMLVTESMRMDANGNQDKTFTMSRLTNNNSSTAQNYRLTLEFTSNPAWYAVQALPVLSNPDNDNAVSWFASYYSNTLGAYIGKAYPKVSAMINAWKQQGGSTETLLSQLQKNEELKDILLEETPWVLEAKNEAEQKEKLSLLFDLNRNQNLTRQAIDKLAELQTSQGGWSWFKGFYPSVSISQYVLYGFHQLKELKAVEFSDEIRKMQAKAISYIDSEALRRFEEMKKYNKDWRKIQLISTMDLEYVYVRALYPQYTLSAKNREMLDFYTGIVEKYWTQYDMYQRSLIAILMHRNGKQNIVADILKSYREHATTHEEMGMFWANNRSHVFMSQSAVSVHTFIMDAFSAGDAKADEMDNMKRWLLKQKQTQSWESTHATMDAIYALLSTGTDWFSSENKTTVIVADKRIEPAKQELGTGYFKESWQKSEIVPQMGKVKIENSGNAPAWGALYLQYYEDLDKITKTDASLDVEKQLFREQTDAGGRKLMTITENSPLKVGDKVTIRLTVRADRDFEFVHLKDMRAASFEPVEQLSGVKWQGGTIYYQTSKDASTHFFFDHLSRGTYVFEYDVFVTRAGNYSNGITTVQCLYAPEFTSHTQGIRVDVSEK